MAATRLHDGIGRADVLARSVSPMKRIFVGASGIDTNVQWRGCRGGPKMAANSSGCYRRRR